MRIAVMMHTLRPSGAELAMLRLLPGLAEHDITVIAGEGGPLEARLRELPVRLVRVALPAQLRGLGRQTGWRAIPAAAVASVGYTSRLIGVLRQGDFDLIHANSTKAAVFGTLPGLTTRTPVIWHLRDQLTREYMGRSAGLIRILAGCFAAGVLANSASTLSTLPRSRGPRVVAASPLGPEVDFDFAPQSPEPLVLVMIGRISPWKGQDVFISALAALPEDAWKTAYIIGSPLFGEDDYLASLTRLIADLGLADKVVLVGQVDDTTPWLHRAHLMVHASVLPEPFGQVIVEAMAAGTPVIATNAGGPAEIITAGVDGLLVEPGNVNALTTAISQLHGSPDDRESMIRAARETAAQYRLAAIAPRVLDTYAVTARSREGQRPL
ncbi:glycosyltransferase [uncultured Modestobacter sp.]|uniref:glycosyltransferase n=1 Tax=uncultured Modestobacter sp. TaxID=380048 RepID=UPI00260E49A3|nr:glycosyltransferase [uncultured Modestobacter sp.]